MRSTASFFESAGIRRLAAIALVCGLVPGSPAILQAEAARGSAPSARTGSATMITTTDATLTGSVAPRGGDTTVTFDYGTTLAFGSRVAATPGTVAGNATRTDVSVALAGLAPGTTYHFRVRAVNRFGTDFGSSQVFTTSATATPPPPVTAPSASTQAASGITASGATLNGTVNGNGESVTASFEHGTTTAYGSSTAAQPASIAAGAGSTTVTLALTGIACGTTIHYRAKANGAGGTAVGANQSFTTPPCAGTPTPAAPSVTSLPASAVSGTAATLNGSVGAGNADTSVTFEFGPTTAYGTTLASTPAQLVAASATTAVFAAAAPLACGSTYHYRIVATNAVGTTIGADQSFTTTPCGSAFPWPVWTPGLVAVPPSTTGTTWYVDGTNGNNANTGRSATAAFKTIAKALAGIAAGDTVLIRKGLYREGINLNAASAPSGTAARPITFGSYGDGEVILDGSPKVTGWTNVGGTVWRAPVAFAPIAIVVNEVPLRQVRQGQGGSTAPQEGVAGVTSGSGKWHVGGGFLTADMGTTLGAGDPNSADIVVPRKDGAQEHVFWYDQHHLRFRGLTVRGNGSNGLWGYGGNVTVESCDIKFNGKAAVSFLPGEGISNADNAVLTSHAYHNNLVNWPRGNNGYAESGGGWPGTLVWSLALRPVARGNLVHMNGGEGIISYGSESGRATGSALFEQNVAYDNWSVNMYFDNQPDNVARQNFLFNHPPRSADFLHTGTTWPWNELDKYTVCLMLADEQGSSDATNDYANLANTQVVNNVMAGCRIGIRDYAEGSITEKNHGLKNTVIANNTIVMPANAFTGGSTYGIYLVDNRTPSGTQRNTGSRIQNNVVLGYNDDKLFFTELKGAQGIDIDGNVYTSPSTRPFGAGYASVTFYDFAGWKAAITGADAGSFFADPLLADRTRLVGPGVLATDFGSADLQAASPARGTGIPQPFLPSVNFLGAPRTTWNRGAF